MNILDVKNCDVPETITIKSFLDAQRVLLEKYIPIELKSGILHTGDIPVSIDSPRGQARIKDGMWRITEELMEAWEVHERSGYDAHYYEEVIDAFHFFLGLLIVTGLDKPEIIYSRINADTGNDNISLIKNRVDRYNQNLKDSIFSVIYNLGLAANCLKQKAWKQTHIPTDVRIFSINILHALYSLFDVFHFSGMSSAEIYVMYFKKNEVNKFRIRSNY